MHPTMMHCGMWGRIIMGSARFWCANNLVAIVMPWKRWMPCSDMSKRVSLILTTWR